MDKFKGRLVGTLFILVFLFALAAARTGYIQVVRGEHYARQAMAGETEGVALEDYARGGILDRQGRPLTGSYRANRVVVFPQLLEEPLALIGELYAAAGVDCPEVVKKMIKDGKPVVLPFAVAERQLELIRAAGREGLVVAPYSFRYGPRPLASHVLGHLGRVRDARELAGLNQTVNKPYRLSDWVGRQGLELYYEKELKGIYPASLAGLYTDALGQPLAGLPVVVETGLGDFTRSDLVTTIDADIQEVVERVMDRQIKKGAVVVMERSSGDILAMASRPSYNPGPGAGELTAPGDEERFVNQAVSLFQPGSIFKVVVAAAALSEGLAGPGSRFYCRGGSDSPIRCWNEEGHGSITLAEAFAQSCNPVFAGLGRELGPERLIRYARALGLDSQEILGYPAQVDRRQDLGLIAGRYNLVNSSVGQGPVLATPVQITAMINAVANGGAYLPPRLVREVRPARGEPRKISPGQPVAALSPEVARQVSEMMVMVTRQGVGLKAWLARGGSAGKTGSAQLGQGVEAVNAWFSGYAPLDSPAYTITVLVREGLSGGDTAAPVFREIAEKLPDLEKQKTRP